MFVQSTLHNGGLSRGEGWKSGIGSNNNLQVEGNGGGERGENKYTHISVCSEPSLRAIAAAGWEAERHQPTAERLRSDQEHITPGSGLDEALSSGGRKTEVNTQMHLNHHCQPP